MRIGELKNEQKTGQQKIGEKATRAIMSVYSIGKDLFPATLGNALNADIKEMNRYIPIVGTKRRAIALVESKDETAPQKNSLQRQS